MVYHKRENDTFIVVLQSELIYYCRADSPPTIVRVLFVLLQWGNNV
jgi:hypothetical protein